MRIKTAIINLLTHLLLLSLLAGCLTVPPEQEPESESFVQITFILQCPDIATGESVYIEFLDEVTGLTLNPSRYQMELIDDQNFRITLPFKLGSFLKYRFIKGLNPIVTETTADGEKIRYRFFWAQGNNLIINSVAAWADGSYTGPTGRLQGIVNDRNGVPIPNAMINISGNQAVTGSDGKFYINGVIPGTHIITVFSLDGEYQPFQQEAVIDAGAITPATITLSESQWVKVIFSVKAPQDSSGLPIRIVGDLTTLGNTFTDLYFSSASVLASRAPIMNYQSNGVYTLSLNLPSGYDVGYRYSLGDGYWNAEYKSDGNYRVRHLIVPEYDTEVNEVIDTWSPSKDILPVSFTVTIPASTPISDHISIQLNAMDWSTPLPMWSLGNNQWYYILYNPHQDFSYRYCRNDLCGVADNQATAGTIQSGQAYTGDQTAIFDTIDTWQWWISEGDKATVKVVDAITPKGKNFMAGIELLEGYDPSWMPQYAVAANNIKDIGANSVIIPSIWTYKNFDSNDIVMIPLANTSELDTVNIISLSSNFQTVLYPRTINSNTEDLWEDFVVTDEWYKSWFDQYGHFLISNALLAQRHQVDAMIIDDPLIFPLVSEEILDSRTISMPENHEELWRGLITEIRSIYSGTLLFAIDYKTPNTSSVPGWIDQFDQIYVKWSVPLATSSSSGVEQMVEVANSLLEMDIFPIYQQYQKPVVIAVDYASAVKASTGCIYINEQCRSMQYLDQPQDTMARSVNTDFQLQVDAYSSLLSIINQKNWINGFVSTGYFYPTILHDSSSSIHGKPAADLLWYWFPKLTLEQ